MLGLCLGAPAVVAGERGPMDALGESWDLTGGHRLDLLLAFLATAGVALVASVAFAIATSFLVRVAPQVPSVLVQVCGELVRTVAAAPVITVSVLAYLRLSRRFTDGD